MKTIFFKTARLLRRLATFFYVIKFKFKKATGLLSDPVIQPYLGYGNTESIFVFGRVLEKYVLSKPLDRHNLWDNIKAMYRRYTSDFISNVELKVTFKGQEKVICTDDEGYFQLTFDLDQPLTEDWVEVDLELLTKVVRNQGKVTAKGEVMVSERNSQFGIISDVDDTILISRATTIYRKLRLLLLKNAHTRLPFEGVAGFYHALRKGRNFKSFNPIFYVSSSSWKLYDLLTEFCAVRGIPKGPFMLRASRIDDYKFISSIHSSHKLQKIESVMEAYKNLKFILIGDSGQKDPEIYNQVVKDYPGRVEAIYIRDVSKEKRDIAIQRIAEDIKELGVEMVYINNTVEAAKHALEKGYISTESLSEISEEFEKDEHYSDDPDELVEEEEQEEVNRS